MTAIKQTSVCSEKHLARLRDYLSWDREKALAHGTQNIIDDDRWFQEMADTRAAMGHDRPGKAVPSVPTCSTRYSGSSQTSATSTAGR